MPDPTPGGLPELVRTLEAALQQARAMLPAEDAPPEPPLVGGYTPSQHAARLRGECARLMSERRSHIIKAVLGAAGHSNLNTIDPEDAYSIRIALAAAAGWEVP